MKQYDGIIWDLDGTLADTLADLADSVNELLVKAGKAPYPLEQYRTFVGNGAPLLLVRAFGLASPKDLPPALLEAFKATYLRHLLNKTTLYPCVLPWMQACRRAGMKTAVCTNKPEEAAVKLLQVLLGEDVPDLILGGRSDRPKKPAPNGVADILARWNMKPERCLYVGDSDVDMQTAANAHVDVLAAGWGFRDSAELLAYCPTYYAPTAQAAMNLMFSEGCERS